jgi:ABC-type antimicrobial peptide transport system permease subunit
LGIGLAVGVGLSLAAARTASSMLFGLKPHDPATLTFAISVLALVAVAASYIPARRAAGVDPMVALREE